MGRCPKAYHILSTGAVVLLAVIGLVNQAASAQGVIPVALVTATQPALGGGGRVVEPLSESVWVAPGQSKVLESPMRTLRVSITDPTVADVKTLSPTQIMLVGKTVGTTDLLVWDEQEHVMRAKVQVMVADLEVVALELRRLFPDTTLELSPSGRAVVLSGTLARAEQVEQLHNYFKVRKIDFIDMTRVPGVQQVQLQVRVAEVSRQAIRALGLNFIFAGSDFQGASFVGADGSGPLNPTPVVAGGTASVSPAVTVFGRFPNADLSFFLQALAENQYLRVLAEPSLTALSGEKASFLAGGQFPIPVIQSNSTIGGGTAAITVEYKDFGVKLMFEPVVLGENRIRMRVAPEVSELSDVGAITQQGFRIPSLIMRSFETTLELSSGQTFAMAGLLQRTSSGRTSRIPGLGDIPVLGALFRSTRYAEGETELVVLVTASVVEPVSAMASSYVLPGETHAIPNDWEFYCLGHIEGKTVARVSPEQARWLEETGLDNLRGPGAWASCGGPAPAHDMKGGSRSAPVAPPPPGDVAPPPPPKDNMQSSAPPPAGADVAVQNAAAVTEKPAAPEGQKSSQ
jgi:pilus assembly protein CpaC